MTTAKHPVSKSPVISIITVNWKAAQATCEYIESLFDMNYQQWYLSLCDNGSNDGSDQVLRTFLSNRFQEVPRESENRCPVIFDYFCSKQQRILISLILSDSNLGFAGGCNLSKNSIHQSIHTQYFWYLNNDTLVAKDALKILIEKMQSDPEIGICGATILYESERNRVQVLGGAKFCSLIAHIREIGLGSEWPRHINEKHIESQLDYISGASMFIRPDFIRKVGDISEDYFLYFEEIDWAIRGRQHGYRLGYASKAVVFHKEGFVLGSGKSKNRGKTAQYYSSRGRILITKKFFPLAIIPVYIFSLLQMTKLAIQGRYENAQMVFNTLLNKEPDAK